MVRRSGPEGSDVWNDRGLVSEVSLDLVKHDIIKRSETPRTAGVTKGPEVKTDISCHQTEKWAKKHNSQDSQTVELILLPVHKYREYSRVHSTLYLYFIVYIISSLVLQHQSFSTTVRGGAVRAALCPG